MPIRIVFHGELTGLLNNRGLSPEATRDLSRAAPVKDLMPYLTAVKEADPDVILASGYYAEAAGIVKQAHEIKLRTQIIGEEGCLLYTSRCV